MRTLRARVTSVAVLVTGLGLAAGAWVFVRATGQALTERVDGDLAAVGRGIATRLAEGAAPSALIDTSHGDQIVQIRRPDGSVVAGSKHHVRQSSDLDEIEIIDDPRMAPAGRGWITGTSDLSRLGHGWRVVHTRAGGPAAPVDVVVAAPLVDVRRSTEAVAALAYTSVPVLMMGVGGLVWVALGRLLRSVEHVRRQAAAAVDVYPPPRLDAAGGAEIEALIQTIDDLLQRAAAGVRRQRGFLADASHELLTPLASMRTLLEVAQRRRERADWTYVAERCLQTQARLEQVAQHLLTLARTEAGAALPLAELDLAELVSAAAGDATAGQTDVAPVVHVPGGVRVRGDRIALSQLVDNLLRNAVRHAETRVDVHLRTAADAVILDVDDDGPGIDEPDRTIVFEPFVRLDRARDRGHGGAGLGLSIVHAVASSHGGSVHVSTSPLAGARFTVVLPRRVQDSGAIPPGRFIER